MPDSGTRSRLDPAALDPIVLELDLTEASALERLQLWYRDLLLKAWDWIKSITGGEGGWLDRATDWFGDLFKNLTGGEPISADSVVTGLTWFTILLLTLLGIYMARTLYRLYRPAPVSQQPLPDFLTGNTLQKPLAELPAEQWAPALFYQVARTLFDRNALTIPAHATNAALAEASDLTPELAIRMQQLASAADRALFAGWSPDPESLRQLQAHRDAILQAVPEQP